MFDAITRYGTLIIHGGCAAADEAMTKGRTVTIGASLSGATTDTHDDTGKVVLIGAIIAPIFIVWLGADMSWKVLTAFAIAFCPIVTNTAIALSVAQPKTIYLARCMKAKSLQTFWMCAFPRDVRQIPSKYQGGDHDSIEQILIATISPRVSAADRRCGRIRRCRATAWARRNKDQLPA